MFIKSKTIYLILTLTAFGSILSVIEAGEVPTMPDEAAVAEARAVEFLTREVPAWSKNNGCFSCHNNGDAARALYAASQKGYRVSPEVLADTTAWVREPARWDENKGDPGFSDKRLATIQFASSLLAAMEAGHVNDGRALQQAAAKIVGDQAKDGAWHIDQGNTLGSPATYGTPLATYMALKTLRRVKEPEITSAVRKAERWIGRQASPDTVLAAATLLLATAQETNSAALRRKGAWLRLIHTAQTADGGWGPYADSPPEVFDTAVVLLALAQSRTKRGVENQIRRGRRFLVAQQNPDGSWPATTRPSGGDSYAQRISTTGWATLALLETR